jgi:hypothetical protein
MTDDEILRISGRVRTGEVMGVKDARTRTLCMDAVRDWLRLR